MLFPGEFLKNSLLLNVQTNESENCNTHIRDITASFGFWAIKLSNVGTKDDGLAYPPNLIYGGENNDS